MTGQQDHKPWCASLSTLTAKPRPCDCVRVPLPTTPGSAARSADSADPFCKPSADLEKAARMALEALGYYEVAGLATTRVAKSITALRKALEQPEYASDADTEELTHLNSLPEPLRLAAMLEKTMQWPLHGKAADCLRKMHAALSEQSAQQQEWRGPVDWEAVAADQAMTIAMMKTEQEAAVLAEREACAQVCDDRDMGDCNREDMEARACAAAIRARKTP